MATIYADSGSAPVRIRDMSPRGALIEGAAIPPSDSRVRLRRGRLSTAADVVWVKDGRAGLRFETSVAVADWLPTREALSAQHRIDEIVQLAKAAGPANLSAPLSDLKSRAVTALELAKLRMALEALAGDLSDDPAVIARHGEKLQTLDLAVQMLRKLAAER